jgi:hypothetical protein
MFTLRDIHMALKDINTEAPGLAVAIRKKFEEVGI